VVKGSERFCRPTYALRAHSEVALKFPPARPKTETNPTVFVPVEKTLGAIRSLRANSGTLAIKWICGVGVEERARGLFKRSTLRLSNHSCLVPAKTASVVNAPEGLISLHRDWPIGNRTVGESY
jgi:hypothetical protein